MSETLLKLSDEDIARLQANAKRRYTARLKYQKRKANHSKFSFLLDSFNPDEVD